MSDTPDLNEQRDLPQEERKTRRKFITWAGQFAAGASLAAVGLGLGMRSAHAQPECMPCTDCVITSCSVNRSVCGDINHTLVLYKQYYGCVPSGS